MNPLKAIIVINDEKTMFAHWGKKRVVYDANNLPPSPGIDFSNDPGLTDQSQAADCDVNKIVDTFMKTGVMPGHDAPTLYGDFSTSLDFHDAQNIIAHANQQFEALDAKVRKRFQNDPAEFLNFVENEDNYDEGVKLGIFQERKAPVPSPKATESPNPAPEGGSPLPASPAPAEAPKAPKAK